MKHAVLSACALCALLAAPLRAQDAEKPLPCFPDDGPVALVVEGTPVPEKAILRYVELLRLRHPRLSDRSLLRKALEEGIIPQAAMYGMHKNRIAELTKKAGKIKEQLDSGKAFEKVSVDFSDDPGRLSNNSEIGEFARTGVAGASLSLALEDVAFKMKKGTVSAAVVSPVGIQFVKVLDIVPNADPRLERRKLAHILMHYNADYSKALRAFRPGVEDPAAAKIIGEIGDRTRRGVMAARAEVRMEKYRGALYPYRIANKKDG